MGVHPTGDQLAASDRAAAGLATSRTKGSASTLPLSVTRQTRNATPICWRCEPWAGSFSSCVFLVDPGSSLS